MKIQLTHTYQDIISVENLLAAWREFVRDKKNKTDVQEFSLRLMDSILTLRGDLLRRTYQHGPYQAFKIHDPKPRDIHKASVRDRLLHHALHRILYPFFDKTFIADSYSCRLERGTHRAMTRFRAHARAVSRNHTKTCWVLKCDIRKFFANIDQAVLIDILDQYIPDADIMNLLQEVIGSFSSGKDRVGLPLGNLTSQLLVNIYMNKFDQFMKHKLKAKYYIRYADDFVIFGSDRQELENLIPSIRTFLAERLKLELHPQKVSIATVASGVDFLGWVHFPDHRVLRTATKKRMIRRLKENKSEETKSSYLGLLGWGNTYRLRHSSPLSHLLTIGDNKR